MFFDLNHSDVRIQAWKATMELWIDFDVRVHIFVVYMYFLFGLDISQ